MSKYEILPQSGGPGGNGSDTQVRFAQRINADIATNLNNLTQTTVPIDGTALLNGSGWSINGNGLELTGPDSFVRCSASLHVAGAVNRLNMLVRLGISDGIATPTLFGPVAAHGYIRNATGHNESSYTILPTWVFMTQGQVITLESFREANAGNLTMALAGSSQLLLERYVNV